MRTDSIFKIMAAVLLVTAMLAAGLSPAPAAVAAPMDTAAAQTCTNLAQFVTDVTVPDNTILRGGASFTKTWRVKNTGTCTWSTGYKLMRDSGAALGGPVSVRLSRSVARDSTVDISVSLVAPSTLGTYTDTWQLADATGRRFGPKIRVVIVTPDPALGEALPETLIFMGGAGGGTTKDICSELAEAAGAAGDGNPHHLPRAGHAPLHLRPAGQFDGQGDAHQPRRDAHLGPVRRGWRRAGLHVGRRPADGRGHSPDVAGNGCRR